MEKILLVDDDSLQVDILRHNLNDKFIIESVENGVDAIKRAKFFNPDIILMDIDMPMMNGYEACKKIRDKGNDVPIIFLSHLDTVEDKISAYAAGGDDFLGKPFDDFELNLKIESNLKRKAQEAKAQQQLINVVKQSMTDISYLEQVVVFLQKSFSCANINELSRELFSLFRGLDLHVSARFNLHDQPQIFFDDDVYRPIEETLLNSIQSSDKVIEFGNSRAVYNWNHCRLLIRNMPDSEILRSSMQGYLSYLLDGLDEAIKRIILEHRLRHSLSNYKKENYQLKLDIMGMFETLEVELLKEFEQAGLNDELSIQVEDKLIEKVKSIRDEADARLIDSYSIEHELDEALNNIR